MKRREPPILFIDRSLGKNVIASALRAAGASVEIHDDHFAPDAPDQLWLLECAIKNWIVLTKDKRIRRRSAELIAVAHAGARVFCLTAGQLTAAEMAQSFVTALPRIYAFSTGNPAPFIAAITRAGAVSLLMNASQLKKLTRKRRH